jgi:hypothetical protein
MWQIGGEVALRQPVAALNASEQRKALDASWNARPVRPGGDRLAIDGDAVAPEDSM